MTILRGIFVALLTWGCWTSVLAEPFFPDALLEAYLKAARSVSAGEKRSDALAELNRAIEKHPDSRHLHLAKRLASDLAASVEQAAARAKTGRTVDDAPAEFLSETELPLGLLAHPANWEQALPAVSAKLPRDPAVLLLQTDRKCIDSLLPQLGNDAPTRSFNGRYIDLPSIPRVCDIALGLIEKVSGCIFHFNASSGELFHEQSAAKRDKIAAHIAAWWRDNKGKSVAEGIRAQLPQGDLHATMTMAENLIRAAGTQRPQDRAHGLKVLRQLARSRHDYPAAKAARVLEKYDDPSLIGWHYGELRESLSVRGRYWNQTAEAVFYLTHHGGRKDWEALYGVAVKDLTSDAELPLGRDNAYVLGCLVNSKQAATSPYAIPALGLALGRIEETGVRSSARLGPQPVSMADKAAEYLQAQTGMDFGYQRAGPASERAAAIEKAQAWWAAEGQAKFTFDYIEQQVAKGAAAKPPP